jgi:hypothetical protein
MKKIVLLMMAIFMVAVTGVSAKSSLTLTERINSQDTIIVKMANGAKMILHLQNMEQLKAFENYSLDSLMRELNKYVNQNTGKAPKQITVTMDSHKGSKGESGEKVVVMVQETDQDGKVKKERHEIRIGKIKVDVNVEEDGENTWVDVNTAAKNDKDDKKDKDNKFTNFNFDIDLGLNTFANQDAAAGVLIPDLKPTGSRYVSLNFHVAPRIGGKESPLFLMSGFEIAFNNYMFEKNVFVQDIDNNTVFTTLRDVNFDKSKLATSSINIPLVPMLKFKRSNGKDGFHIGAGGFAGYRLGGHSKLKYEMDSRTSKDKDRGSFNMNDFQYGATGVVGYNNLSLFLKYNMNTLFKENRGPEVNTISFGLRLLN